MLYFSKWKTISIIAAALFGILYAAPNLFSKKSVEGINDPLPNRQVKLGLDLQGGSHLLLEMDTSFIVKTWLNSIRSDISETLWKKNKIEHVAKTNISGKEILVRIGKGSEQAKALALLQKNLVVDLNNSIMGGVSAKNLTVVETADKQIKINITKPALLQRVNKALGFAIETLGRRINALGTTEPTIQRQGKNRILVQVPGLKDPEELKKLISKTGSLTFQMVDPSFGPNENKSGRVPFLSERVWEYQDGIKTTAYILKKKVIVGGTDLVDAQPSFDPRTNQPVITFRFNGHGAKSFGQATSKNVGRLFAIVLDNKVISAATIQEPILTGSGQISGSFSSKETTRMSILLRSGALPAPLQVVEERTVGASLGKDAVAAGFMASMLGLVVVIALVFVSYGTFGLFANVALVVNMILLMAILSILQATLTLPGIAGIVLTVGMAVDANVLIYERIREEIRNGKPVINAIDAGYRRAFGTIVDANITTFIAAVILFFMGSGPVKGFAVTLSIGIITSVFTAFTLTRLIVSWWAKREKHTEIPI